jgi:selenocysteine-specific elongation factor
LEQGLVVAIGASNKDASVLLATHHLMMSTATWQSLMDQIIAIVGEYHRQHPLRAGMLREELKSRLKLETRLFDELILEGARTNRLVAVESFVHLPNHVVKYSAMQQGQVDRLLRTFEQNRFTPPSVTESETQVGAEVFNALIEQGKLVKVNDEVVFSGAAYREMVNRITAHLKANPSITVAQVRDMFGASRKYALGLMEYLDQQHITRRIGDERVLR